MKDDDRSLFPQHHPPTLAEQLTRMVNEGHEDEVIEVLVVTLHDEHVSEDEVREVIETIAPQVVSRVHDRIPGKVLRAEPCEGQDEGLPTHWHALVEDLGPDTGQVIH